MSVFKFYQSLSVIIFALFSGLSHSKIALEQAVVEVPFNLVGVKKIRKTDCFLDDSLCFLLGQKPFLKLLEGKLKGIPVVFDLLIGKKEK